MVDDTYESEIYRNHSQCSHCEGILHELRTETSEICPFCGKTVEVWQVYPSASASHLIERINYFYSQASTKHRHAIMTVTQKISQELQREVSEKAVYEGWLRLNKAFAKASKTASNTDDALANAISQFFRCSDNEKIHNIILRYLQVEFNPPEVEVVPILTVALVESLFNDLLLHLKREKEHKSYRQAMEELASIPSFRVRYNVFEQLTGEPFHSAIVSVYPPASKTFWDVWRPVLRKRNDFIHLTPYALGWRMCKKAYHLAAVSSSVFAELHNVFAKTVP